MRWKVFLKNLPSHFFTCLYFIGVCGDENLKIYLVWPNTNIKVLTTRSLAIILVGNTCADPEGGRGFGPPRNHKMRVS